MNPWRSVLVVALAAAEAACGDPVHDDAVAVLGGEAPGIPPGPLHRPGQPCLTCHGEEGPAETAFSYGGTVFEDPAGAVPVCGAAVRVTNDDGEAWEVTSNVSGNFYVYASDFAARFPATTAVRTALGTTVMHTYMNRTGSCNQCHQAGLSQSSPGAVWVAVGSGVVAGCDG